MPSVLRRLDYEDYLIHLIFGAEGDHLQKCLRRAYLDFNRTLHGIRKNENIYQAGADALRRRFESIQRAEISTQDQFDEWHKDSCVKLAAEYEERGYSSLYVGQAQKWLNMTFKYIFVFGEERVPGYSHLYGFCHVPLDNILLEAVENHSFEPLLCAWSRLNDYEVYLNRQRWFRSNFPQAPLDVEFSLWMARPLTI
jgi:hypothetical protein